jgi:hypothetical protein
VETGLTLEWGGSSFADVLSIPKGVIWLFLATFAEVTPAVSPASFGATHSFFSSLHHVTGVCFVGSER